MVHFSFLFQISNICKIVNNEFIKLIYTARRNIVIAFADLIFKEHVCIMVNAACFILSDNIPYIPHSNAIKRKMQLISYAMWGMVQPEAAPFTSEWIF